MPTLLYALGTAGLVGALARSTTGQAGVTRWTAPLAVGIFVTCPLVLTEGARALLDMGLAFWTTLVLLAVQRARGQPGWWWVAGAAAVGGSLQKISLPAGVLFGVVAWRMRSPAGRAGLRAGRGALPGGLVLALVGTVLWPLLLAGLQGAPAERAFSLAELTTLRGNSRLGARPPWEVFARLTTRWSWGLFALVAAGAAVLGREAGEQRQGGTAPNQVGEVGVICLGLVLVITLAGFRSVRYVLPAVPGLCVVAAAAITRVATTTRGRWVQPAATALTLGLFGLGMPAVWHRLQAHPAGAPDQHPLALALGGWLRPGEAAVLVREVNDEEEADGVLREEFYLFYGGLHVPVQSVTRADWETWAPPPGGALGVCRAADFSRFRARAPGAEVRLERGPFVLWRVNP